MDSRKLYKRPLDVAALNGFIISGAQPETCTTKFPMQISSNYFFQRFTYYFWYTPPSLSINM